MGRTAKESGKPKGKTSAYTFFMQESREELKKKDPNKAIDLATLSKQVSSKWKALGEKERKKYEDMAAKDVARFKEEMADYVPTEETKKRKRGKAGKDPNAPKRALSAFFCFSNEERSKVKGEHPGYTVGDVAKELGKRWEACKDRKKWEALAAKDKERYEREKAAYNGQSNGAAKKPAAKGAQKAKPASKRPRRGKDTDDEDDEKDDDDDDEDHDDEEEDNESD